MSAVKVSKLYVLGKDNHKKKVRGFCGQVALSKEKAEDTLTGEDLGYIHW